MCSHNDSSLEDAVQAHKIIERGYIIITNYCYEEIYYILKVYDGLTRKKRNTLENLTKIRKI